MFPFDINNRGQVVGFSTSDLTDTSFSRFPIVGVSRYGPAHPGGDPPKGARPEGEQRSRAGAAAHRWAASPADAPRGLTLT